MTYNFIQALSYNRIHQIFSDIRLATKTKQNKKQKQALDVFRSEKLTLNVLKSDLEKSRICPVRDQSGHLDAKSDIPLADNEPVACIYNNINKRQLLEIDLSGQILLINLLLHKTGYIERQ